MADKKQNSGANAANNPERIELPPLVLPDGISPDTASRWMLNVLLRRALSEENPLSKWILLGSVEILQGRSLRIPAATLAELASWSTRQSGEEVESCEPSSTTQE